MPLKKDPKCALLKNIGYVGRIVKKINIGLGKKKIEFFSKPLKFGVHIDGYILLAHNSPHKTNFWIFVKFLLYADIVAYNLTSALY
jgi:hypothetical protein